MFDDFNTFLSPTEIRNDILNWSVSQSFLINSGSICVFHSRVSLEKQEKVRNDLTRQSALTPAHPVLSVLSCVDAVTLCLVSLQLQTVKRKKESVKGDTDRSQNEDRAC